MKHPYNIERTWPEQLNSIQLKKGHILGSSWSHTLMAELRWKPNSASVTMWYAQQKKKKKQQQKSISMAMTLGQIQRTELTLWSAEDKTWEGTDLGVCPGRWGPGGLWGSWGLGTGLWCKAPLPPLPASCRQTSLAALERRCTHLTRGCSWLLCKNEKV